MNKFWKEAKDYIIIVVVVVIIRTFLVTPAIVDGASMDYTLEDGQLVIVNKIVYKMNDVDRFDIPDIFIKGAEWMQKKMIEKACEWLDEHWNDYFSENDDFNGWNMISDFRKAMEE